MQIKTSTLLFGILCLAPTLHAETLASVLTAHGIPATVLPENDRERPITSFAASADRGPFLLAYYEDDGSGTLPPPLHVLRYDRQTNYLLRVDLQGSPTQFHGFDKVMHDIPAICLGSALGISEKNGLVLISTHINPSAGCILILTPGLKFSVGLWGWTLGQIGDNIIYEENTIHFAPVHPERVTIYNPQLKELTPIYPASSDSVRKEFSEQLKKYLPSRDLCMQQNLSCDTTLFSSDIQNFTINEQGRSFTFDAQMTAEGFGEQAEQSIQPQVVKYGFRLIDKKWVLTSSQVIKKID